MVAYRPGHRPVKVTIYEVVRMTFSKVVEYTSKFLGYFNHWLFELQVKKTQKFGVFLPI